jgi:tetratricopeptide (TPR) repeat protein
MSNKRPMPIRATGRPEKKPRRPLQPNSPHNSKPRRVTWLLLPALLLATLAAYYPAWHGGMLWDDDRHITRSDLRSAEGLSRIWFDLGATQQYYPLTHSAFWVLQRLWGDDTLGYHLMTIILHVFSAFLVAILLERLAVPGAWLAALLFALHPVHVESVAWISELKNTLSGVLYLSAALAYLHFDSSRRKLPYALAMVLFILALLSKTVTATLPAALLVVFWWQRGKLNWRRDVLPLLPFFMLGAAGGLLTAWVERTLVGAQGAEYHFTMLERCLIAGRVVWFYLGKLFWPADLIFIYPRWQVTQNEVWQFSYPLGLLVLLAGLWQLRKRSRAPLAAILLYCGTLLPALGFFNVYPFRYSFVADHFQYLASITIIALCSAGLATLAKRWKWAVKPAAVATTMLLGGTLAAATWIQSGQYLNAETLYRTTLSRNPSCWMASNNLGNALQKSGRIEEAISQYIAALQIKPDYAEAYNNLGHALHGLGRLEEAVTQYQEAIRLMPNLAGAHHNLANALQELGRVEEAAAHYAEALRLEPGTAEAHNNLGMAMDRLGRFEEAVTHFKEALRIRPDYAIACDNLGNALQRMGRIDEAMAQYRQAIRLKPDFAQAYDHLGSALQVLRRYSEAVVQHKEALRFRPDSAEVYSNLGNALLGIGQQEEAIAQYRQALRLKPDLAGAYFNLGNALLGLGRPEEAIAQYREAVRLKPDFAGAHYNLGQVLQQLGRLEEAAAQYREVIKCNPVSADAHNSLGVALAGRGLLAEAVVHFKEAVRLRPDFTDAQANLARALAMLNKK